MLCLVQIMLAVHSPRYECVDMERRMGFKMSFRGQWQLSCRRFYAIRHQIGLIQQTERCWLTIWLHTSNATPTFHRWLMVHKADYGSASLDQKTSDEANIRMLKLVDDLINADSMQAFIQLMHV